MSQKKCIFLLVFVLTASSLFAGNLYPNSGFESNVSGWTLYKQDTSVAATMTLDSVGVLFGKKYCRITVTKVNADPVANNWYIQLQDPVWQPKKNIKYTFSCWAKADTFENRSIHIAAQGDSTDKYKYRAGGSQSLTKEWTKYEYPFTSDFSGPAGQLNFFVYLGGSTGVYDFDSMALDTVTVPDTGSAVLGSSARIAPDKGFFDVQVLPNTMRIILTAPISDDQPLRLYSLEGRLMAIHKLPAAASAFEIPIPGRGAWVVEVNSKKKVIRAP